MIGITDKSLIKQMSYIDGEWVQSPDHFDIVNPGDGQRLIQMNDGSPDQAVLAVEAAHRQLKSWSALSANERSTLLMKWHALIEANAEDLALLLSLEQGKPLVEARGEINYGASYIEWFAAEGKRAYGDTIPSASHDKMVMVIKQPVGVVTAITPWNFPNAMITRKAAAALAAGCTFVVRPSELTPLSALALAELAHRAGIPAGVFNVIVGTQAIAIGEVLTKHPAVAKFTFTGSTPVGRQLISQCASSVKKVSMELGGNAPFIVFDDADIDEAVKGAIASKFRNAGQTCVCSNRFYIHENILEEFVSKFVTQVNALKLGQGIDEDTTIGPMISPNAVSRVDGLVQRALAQGASLATGGQKDNLGEHYYQATVLTDVENSFEVTQQEIFGPVAPIIGFKEEADVVAMANDTEFGLAAYVYSRDIGRVMRVSRDLEFGMVGINEGIISNAAAPFGGVKQSGYGREGSKYGLDDYMEIKYLALGGLA